MELQGVPTWLMFKLAFMYLGSALLLLTFSVMLLIALGEDNR